MNSDPVRKPRVLVIDDELQIRRLLRVSLEAEGFRVEEAATGREGLVLAAQRRPEVILLDLGLPDLDGVTVPPPSARPRTAGIASASITSSPPVPKVKASDVGSTKYHRRHPATWKRSMNTVKRSKSSRPQVRAWYSPKSMRESRSSRKRRSHSLQLMPF